MVGVNNPGVRSRQPNGTPVGGQFAQMPKQESGVSLRQTTQARGVLDELLARNALVIPFVKLGITSKDTSVLEQLVDHESGFVRAAVARNRFADPHLLGRLSVDPVRFVRANVAANPNIDQTVLDGLVTDQAWEVRAGVAQNPATAFELLQGLLSDPDLRVRARAESRFGGVPNTI